MLGLTLESRGLEVAWKELAGSEEQRLATIVGLWVVEAEVGLPGLLVLLLPPLPLFFLCLAVVGAGGWVCSLCFVCM